MSAFEPPSLQLSWLDGEAIAWRPESVSRAAPARRGAYGMVTLGSRVVRLSLPHGQVDIVASRLPLLSLATLASRGTFDGPPSASVSWFAEIHRFCVRVVQAGRAVPELTHHPDGSWSARWRALDVDMTAAADLLQAMPAVVAAADPTTSAAQITASIIDSLSRVALDTLRWRPTHLARGRDRGLRLVAHALGSEQSRFVVANEHADEVADIAGAFDHLRQRADGIPLLGARLRLSLPPDPSAESADQRAGHLGEAVGADSADDSATPDEAPRWPLTLEIFDLDDRGKWCTSDDILRRRPMFTSTWEARFADLVERRLADARTAMVTAVEPLAGWLAGEQATLDLDGAAAVLAAAEPLSRAGVELIVPERLAKRRPTSRAAAAPGGGASSGRFNAAAIVTWEATIDGQALDENDLQRIASGGAGLLRAGGRWVAVDRTDAARALDELTRHRRDHAELDALGLMTLAAKLAAEATSESAAGDAPLTDVDHSATALTGSGWVGELLAGLPDSTIAEGVEPEGFTATLRPYQRRGLGWLQFLRRLGLGGCLADDMGLGKTPTTLAHLTADDGPHLVICPLSVVRNWQSEAARFAPGLRVLIHHGSARHLDDQLRGTVDNHDLVVTTYQVATRDIDHLASIDWSTVVFDEAQAVKNAETRTARAMRKLPARQRLALTGTPVENRLSELWSILNTVVPGLLGNAAEFRRSYATPIERNRDQAAAERLRSLTAPFLLRRTKADRTLVPDLPDKIEQIAWATLTPEQAQLYQSVVDQLLADAEQATGMRRRGLVLAALTRLKQICNHPAHALGDGSRLAGRSGKLARFDELVDSLLDAGEQALVFTQFREMGLLLQRHLIERNELHVPFLHGGVAKAQRDRMVDRFQASSASPLLLVSLKAGGTGLNLTAASRVVHYDRWWNPAVEDQATDRAWRIGQRNSVFVHKLVCQGTVEEKIDGLINDKRALAAAVVGTTGDEWLSELSTDELRELVILDRSALARPAPGGGS